MQTIKDVKFKNQIILVRTDYNVPLAHGKVSNNLRIRSSIETLNYLFTNGAAKIVIISHLGRPEGKKVAELSLKPVAAELQKLLPEHKVFFVGDVSGPEVETTIKTAPKGSVILLENLRFFTGEESDSEDFAQEIADSTHAELFVQDGFAVVHRKHASTDAITKIFPSVAGLLVEKEVSNLSQVLKNPIRPLLFVIGGAKVTDKQPLIDKFLPIADQIFVGGKIAADGFKSKSPKIYVAEDFDEDSAGDKLDVGPVSTIELTKQVQSAKTILWNGLLGKAEDPAYSTSSTLLAKILGEDSSKTTIICGGDTTAFVEDLSIDCPDLNYSLISTGGGAALEFLSGKPLPGLQNLNN